MNRFILLFIIGLLISCSGTAGQETGKPGPDTPSDTTQTTPPDTTQTTPVDTTSTTPVDDGIFKVLFIGNSLTVDATCLLPSLLNSAGVKNVELTRTFHGSYTLQLYYQNYSAENICSYSTWKPGWARWRGKEVTDHSPKFAVEADNYDLVCLQEYTGQNICWYWTEYEGAAVDALMEKIRKSQGDNKPEFAYLFSTQFGRGQQRLVESFDNDPVKQFEANVSVISKILEATGIKTVISTGAMQQNLRTTGLNTERDMTRGDQVHCDYGLSRYAAACLVFKNLFTPLTGIEPEDIDFPFEEYYPYSGIYTTPVTEQNKPAMYAAINAAYEHPMEITDLSRFTESPAYVNKPGSLMLDEGPEIEPVTFPVRFAIGDGVVTAYTQPYWNGYGIWVSDEQQQAYAKWAFASYPMPDLIPARYCANAGHISSPGIRGAWTGDWLEFVLPVKDFEAGTTVTFSAPVYARECPVFWAFEWLDGDEWKNDCHEITKDDFTRNASFALTYPSTKVSCKATFANGVKEGKLHFRIRCVDGTIQADANSKTAVERDLPYHTDTAFDSAFCFYELNTPAVVFSISN